MTADVKASNPNTAHKMCLSIFISPNAVLTGADHERKILRHRYAEFG